MNILFLCTGNSCRSILAEAVFNHLAPSGWRAMSAGSQPTGQVHPRSLALLKREGIPTEGLHSKSWDNLPVTPDIVIKQIRPGDEKEDVDNALLREKDLKGHIKSPKENDAKAAGPKKETDNLDRDNQLKNAIDILKSWDILKKNSKG